jgi:hypothetical protein
VRLLKRSALALAILYILASLAAGIFLAEVSLKHTRNSLREEVKNVVYERAALHKAHLTDVAIIAADGAQLKAWHITPEYSNGNAVALFHGVTDTRLGVAGFGELFLARGYSILLPDSRHHGESGGDFATRVLEADDIARWAHWLKQRNPGCIYGFGESMGAALVLQSLRADPSFCAVIGESPFSDFRHAAYDRLSDRTGIPHSLATKLAALPVEFGIIYSRVKYGIDFNLASPRDVVAHSTTPVLLIHGLADRNLLPENSQRIAASRSLSLRTWYVPNAAHCGAWATTGDIFNQRVLNFFAGTGDSPAFKRVNW